MSLFILTAWQDWVTVQGSEVHSTGWGNSSCLTIQSTETSALWPQKISALGVIQILGIIRTAKTVSSVAKQAFMRRLVSLAWLTPSPAFASGRSAVLENVSLS